ncbi:hypothetical protein SLA2020_400430 [Shorea laevis]
MSLLWKDILSIGKENDRAFLCFNEGFSRQLGDRANTSLWEDIWLGTSSLKFEFPWLFNLASHKDSSIANLKPTLVGNWRFEWHRPPFGRELDELEMLVDIMRNVCIPSG